MDGETDIPENTTETDKLVNLAESEFEGESESAEMATLLSDSGGPPQDEVDTSARNDTSTSKPHHPHPYHLKNKYTFRSDSVYSDVIPISAAPQQPTKVSSEPREKSGSLSSLKAKESKWSTLKKKLGRLNSHANPLSSSGAAPSSSSQNKPDGEPERRPPPKSIHEKRSLFQRAKTLSILPVHRSKDKDEHHSPPKRIVEPPELFNVGGEMNLIPLELLIDVNSVGIRK